MAVAKAVFKAGLKVAVVEGVDGELIGKKVEEGFVGDSFKRFRGSSDQGLDDGLAELFNGRRNGFGFLASGLRGRWAGLRGLLRRRRGCFCGGLARFFWGRVLFVWSAGGDWVGLRGLSGFFLFQFFDLVAEFGDFFFKFQVFCLFRWLERRFGEFIRNKCRRNGKA